MLCLALVAACGGPEAAPAEPEALLRAPTTAQRTAAAAKAATSDPSCSGLTPFYWEVGDATGALGHGPGGAAGPAVDPAQPMIIASASKMLLGAYAVQKRGLAALVADGSIQYLHFTSPYVNYDDQACSSTPTVDACFHAGSNAVQSPSVAGRFDYSGGHLQAYGDLVAGLGPDSWSNTSRTPQLATEVQGQIGQIGLAYATPNLAGGGKIAPSGYASFLRSVLGGQLKAFHDALGQQAVCAWTHLSDCNAIYSPVNETSASALTNNVSNQKWHYSVGHWVEQDGTFSSPGADGFYPWLDTKDGYYGILARFDDDQTKMPPPYFASVLCGQAIRSAWLSGQ